MRWFWIVILAIVGVVAVSVRGRILGERRDTVELDSEWHDLWIDLALFRAWERLQQYAESIAVFRALPSWAQARLQHPLSEEDWENLWDEPRVVPSVRARGLYV